MKNYFLFGGIIKIYFLVYEKFPEKHEKKCCSTKIFDKFNLIIIHSLKTYSVIFCAFHELFEAYDEKVFSKSFVQNIISTPVFYFYH